MKFRVKQIGENQFMPQAKKWFLGSWRFIDKNDFYLWYYEFFGLRHCICSTYAEAKQVIVDYKAYQKNQIKYPKYHKL